MSKPDRPTLRHRLEYLAMKVIGRTIVLFPAGLTVNLGALAGAIVARVAPIRRSIVTENLNIAFGDTMSAQEKRRITRETYKNLFMLAVETMYVQYAPLEWVQRAVVEVEGGEQVMEFVRTGQKFICATGHFGSWEVAGAYANSLSPIVAVGAPLHNQLLFDELRQTRERHGIQIIWAGLENPIRGLIQSMKEGRTPALMIDQDARTQGVFVPFFGRPASTVGTPAALALRYDIPLVTSFLVRLGPTRHRLVFGSIITPSEITGDTSEERIVNMLTPAEKELEDMIRLYPAQYFWFHRRWKTSPEQARKRRETLHRRRLEKMRVKQLPLRRLQICRT